MYTERQHQQYQEEQAKAFMDRKLIWFKSNKALPVSLPSKNAKRISTLVESSDGSGSDSTSAALTPSTTNTSTSLTRSSNSSNDGGPDLCMSASSEGHAPTTSVPNTAHTTTLTPDTLAPPPPADFAPPPPADFAPPPPDVAPSPVWSCMRLHHLHVCCVVFVVHILNRHWRLVATMALISPRACRIQQLQQARPM
jgi:hypothetical protein